MKINILVLILCIATLPGCDSHQSGTTNEAIMTEAICVVAAESFGMYKAAERHNKHGKDMVRFRVELEQWESSGRSNDFHLYVQRARSKFGMLGRNGAAAFLNETCDERVTNEMVEKYSGP